MDTKTGTTTDDPLYVLPKISPINLHRSHVQLPPLVLNPPRLATYNHSLGLDGQAVGL